MTHCWREPSPPTDLPLAGAHQAAWQEAGSTRGATTSLLPPPYVHTRELSSSSAQPAGVHDCCSLLPTHARHPQAGLMQNQMQSLLHNLLTEVDVPEGCRGARPRAQPHQHHPACAPLPIATLAQGCSTSLALLPAQQNHHPFYLKGTRANPAGKLNLRLRDRERNGCRWVYFCTASCLQSTGNCSHYIIRTPPPLHGSNPASTQHNQHHNLQHNQPNLRHKASAGDW